MIKNDFETKEQAKQYLEELKKQIEEKQSNLSFSEREKIKQYYERPELLVKTVAISKAKKIITDLRELQKSCQEVNKDDNYKQIIQDLKDTLNAHPEGWGLSANQIGYNRKISFIKIPKKIDQKTYRIEYNEFVLINAEIIEKIGKSSLTVGEGCLSFPGVRVNTSRYLAIMIKYLDENLKEQTALYQGNEALAVQHETDHTNGLTIFDRKYNTYKRR